MVDWQRLLEGSVDGLSLAVGGVCVGDPVRALPYKDITQVMPNTPKVRRERGQDAASGAGDDEPKGAVTQESPLEEVRNRGGHIHFHGGTVACEVAKGLIRKMWVRGPFLRGLPFTAQADIERVFGPARGIERKLGHVLHHYPKRSFSVGWHARENRLDHMIHGAVDWVPPLFGARQVLQEWIAAAHAGLDPGCLPSAGREASADQPELAVGRSSRDLHGAAGNRGCKRRRRGVTPGDRGAARRDDRPIGEGCLR